MLRPDYPTRYAVGYHMRLLELAHNPWWLGCCHLEYVIPRYYLQTNPSLTRVPLP
jgi:hypothetical protein